MAHRFPLVSPVLILRPVLSALSLVAHLDLLQYFFLFSSLLGLSSLASPLSKNPLPVPRWASISDAQLGIHLLQEANRHPSCALYLVPALPSLPWTFLPRWG